MLDDSQNTLKRRAFLSRGGVGLGAMALGTLLREALSSLGLAAAERIHALIRGESSVPLRGLVSGSLDLDKMEYLRRDARFCGVPYGEVDVDRFEFRVLRQQPDFTAPLPVTLHRHLIVVQAGNNNLPIANLGGAVNRQQIAIQDACVAHGHALYSQQVVSLGPEHGRIHAVMPLDV